MDNASERENQFLENLTQIIHSNIKNEQFGVEELAAELGISRSTLHRRLKSTLNKSVSEYIREIRLKRANVLLRNNAGTVSEISFQVGFGSDSYFNRCFNQHFGYPPGEVLKGLHAEPQNTDKVEKKTGIWNFVKQKGVYYLTLVVLLTALTTIIYQFKKEKGEVEKSIVVLPFQNLSNNDEYQYLAEGVTLDIIYRLNQINALRIVSRMSVNQNFNSNENTQEIAEKFDVNYVLTGSIQHHGQNVRIIVELIDVVQDKHVLSMAFDNEYTNIFEIQSNIAKEVASKLSAMLSPGEIEKIEKPPTQNLEAYNLYLKGRFFWSKRTEKGVKKSIGYFNHAVDIDPDYALAWTGLADGYYIMAGRGWTSSKKEGEDKAKECVRKALKIDNNLAEAHASLGFMLCYSDWNWKEAEKELLTAIELNPNYAFAHQIYAQLLDITGDSEKARTEIDIAINLDPLSTIMHYISATLYYNEGNFDKSILELEETLSIEDNNPGLNWWFFKNYYRKGNSDLAMNEIQKIFKQNPFVTNYVDSIQTINTKSGLSELMVWYIEHEKELNLESVELKKQYYDGFLMAEFFTIAGLKNEALSTLEHYLETNSGGDELLRLINNLDYKTLQTEPGFTEIINKLGLDYYYNNSSF